MSASWCLVLATIAIFFIAASSFAFSTRHASLRMSATTEAKSTLRREIVATQSNSKKKWTRVQFPSSEILVKRYASQLEQLQVEMGEQFNLDFGKGLWEEIEGEWRLLYTNNAASAPTTSISVPPPPFSGSNEDIEVFRLESVVQRIERDKFGVGPDTYVHSQVDNILRFELNLPEILMGGEDSTLKGEIVLEHDVKVVSDCYPAKLSIDLRDIKVLVRDHTGVLVDSEGAQNPLAIGLKSVLRIIAGFSGPGSSSITSKDSAFLTMLSIPLTRLLGPSYLRRGHFEVTYVDADTRISRGPFGELRVFERMHVEKEKDKEEKQEERELK